MLKNARTAHILQALLAAVLFGASAPLAKLLLGELDPIPLAALLYLGSGMGLLSVKLFQRSQARTLQQEARVVRADLGWLVGAILAGGVAAPIVLLFSLKNTPAGTAALLLNFEGVATTLIAFWIFKESLSSRAWWAVALVTIGSILLSVYMQESWGFSLGALGIILACVFWGLDNNFTRNIAAKDPIAIVMIKGFGAGSISFILALLTGSKLPEWQAILGSLALGALSYGASIVLYIYAMRGLGAARTSTLFSTAPVVGLVLSVLLLNETPGWRLFAALPLMVAGALLLIYDDHTHTHTHAVLTHEHAHTHDDAHHVHVHPGDHQSRHSHVHTHEATTHTHAHMPDLHHRHEHLTKD